MSVGGPAAADGTPFGRYRLVELLGRGGMGEVWRSFDTVTERTVAIKVLPAHLVDDEMYQERFRREARSAANLDEPHVVPIHDFGEIDGRLHVTMRLVEGCDLQALLADGAIDPHRAVAIIEQIASALHAAHRIGLVHRDVKPSNILIAEDDFAYLIDFGIARAAGETGLTSTGATIGTWEYMAPERFQDGIADARADIYSLTCVLYQSLTGEFPFPSKSLEQLATAHMLKPAPRPSERNDNVPLAMDHVIAIGMAKNPNQRYPTTKDLAQAARAALATTTSSPRTTLGAIGAEASPLYDAGAASGRDADTEAGPTMNASLAPTQQAPTRRASVSDWVEQTSQAGTTSSGSPEERAARRRLGRRPTQPALPSPLPQRWWRRKANRRTAIAILAVPATLFVAALIFAGTTLRFYIADRAAADAKRVIVQTATDAMTTMWSYTPDNIDELPDRSSKYLSGDFQDEYRKYIVAIAPSNKQVQITNKSQVIAAAVEALSGSQATAIVYVNTTSTSPQAQDKPSFKYLSYRLTMQKNGSRWVVGKMTTITNMDVEPKLPGAG